MQPLISIIIPVHNAAATLGRCLDAVNRSTYRNFECLVADDGCWDESAEIAESRGARVLAIAGRRGPAFARNVAAASAEGDILLFIDADVCIQPDTVERIVKAFADDPKLDALIGSYDDDPAESKFVSQYKNLMHCFVHQQGKRRASTFWTGCGAVRRSVFQASGGFDKHYLRPSTEDIELGARLIRAGHKIELEPSLTVKHLKRWTLFGLLECDIRDRAIPWTLLMLRERHIPNDLNVQWSQRISVALMSLALPMILVDWRVSLLFAAVVIAMNHGFYRFLAQRRGALFAIRALPLHLLYFLYSGAAFLAACGIAVSARNRQPAHRDSKQPAPQDSKHQPD
ncbi:MAG TPA: glycosyltransferase family 2 protein [Bryobacteraceae bacterium]|nr:glycosyltransferase family 2 protein [Bryobacteraceae bacterium]